ncbi:MAG TPA: A/G-specific adenine glycosylase [Alphaproteobacteria bacterium]
MQDKTITPPTAISLLRWYDKHGRADLPWRRHGGRAETAYHTWIAEIMLQQTMVAAVIPYYERFMKRWPRVSDLAAADLDEVLSMWAGLGYYARARNLHRCAQVVTEQYDGEFPADAEELKKLPGIGDYTAASVSAIAYDRYAIVVDGNIERVMSRLFLIDEPVNQPTGKALVKADAARLWPTQRSGDFAQALMDLGAMVCTPKDPKCNLCPWQKNCKAFATGRMNEFPVKIKTKVNKPRYALAFIVTDSKGQVLLQQRPASGLLGGLWDVPTTPWQETRWAKSAKSMVFAPSGQALDWQKLPGTVRHVFSHFPLEITVYKAIWSGPKKPLDPGGQFSDAKIQWAGASELPALSNLMQKVLTHARDNA